ELQVTVLFPDGKTRPGVDAVAWLPVPETRGAPSHRPTPQVVQRNKKFEPRVEVVSVGTEVAFPNLDPFYHNVFSLSEIAPFDLGLYRKGASRSVFFAQPGVVRIYCNIHPKMVAFLVVVPSQFFANTNEAGQARLMGIPAGEHSLHLWHEMAGESQPAVTVGGSLTRLHVTLDGSAYRPQ
ncbi:MAG: hypothetical protein NZ869_03005, partial [Thermoanaerobaculum sp.]|nr:hypothetical protein [Thermoanaerobaculum sp.]MDW7967257.1 hypothetical protein [Thermoanaerobaculum sp.]